MIHPPCHFFVNCYCPWKNWKPGLSPLVSNCILKWQWRIWVEETGVHVQERRWLNAVGVNRVTWERWAWVKFWSSCYSGVRKTEIKISRSASGSKVESSESPKPDCASESPEALSRMHFPGPSPNLGRSYWAGPGFGKHSCRV